MMKKVANFWIPTNGKRVKVKSLGIKGTVEYVNMNDIAHSHFSPVQVFLDKPYDDSGHRLYRTGIEDLVKLKKKTTSSKEKPKRIKKKKEIENFDEMAW
ncbi:hypothetical protein ACK8P5_26350 (plasmid) [Paenibacillus sp. EC2-1]|uniref:hypothetical protein n=1 Tax=Paenibacillus sp. EC2-1 TaxID=3388665 RepID=UPI003BEEFE9C